MTRSDLVLAALASAGENARFTPVQVQKLFFLIDREAAQHVGGPHFQFEPYDYGPFDRGVYDDLEALAQRRLAHIIVDGRFRQYALSQEGYLEGSKALWLLPAAARTYITSLSAWVRQLSFEQLVAAIYKQYPDMKAKSIFRG